MLLKDKVAVITGGASGLGANAAELMAKEGARVVATGRREEHGRSLEAALGKDKCLFIRADATQEADVKAMVDACLARWGRLDCLFNNAGGPSPVGGIETVPVEGFDAAMAILAKDTGSHFDPAVMQVFSRIAKTLYQRLEHSDEADSRQLLEDCVRKHFEM